MSAAARPGERRRLVSQETYELVFGTVYTGLVTNLLLVVACLPAVVLLVTTDPRASWPAYAAVAPLLAPALTATFAVFSAFTSEGTTTPVRTFWRAYRTHFRRALAIGALATAAVVVLAVDVAAVWGARVGAAAIPVFVTLIVLVLATTVVALAAVPELRGSRLRDLLRASLYLAVRRWYLSSASLLVLALLGAVVAARPAVGLGLVAAPLLYVAWGGSRYALRALIPDGGAPAGAPPSAIRDTVPVRA
jgi:uncharacterized membrane protein YesL